MVTNDTTRNGHANGGSRRRSELRVPEAIDAERALLGAILADQEIYQSVAGLLEPEDFFAPRHHEIFAAVVAVFERSQSIDQVTVGAELASRGQLQEAGGAAYLNELVVELETTVGAKHYAELIQNAATYRDMIQKASEIGTLGYEAAPDVGASLYRAMELLDSVRGAEGRTDFKLLQLLLGDVLADPMERETGGYGPVRTGFGDLDNLLNGGLYPSEMIVLAARPRVGKSALALTMARNAALGQDVPVAMFSLEMSAEQVAGRLVSAESGIMMPRLAKGRHTEDEELQISRAIGLLSRAQIYIDDTAGQTLTELRAKAKNLHSRLQTGGGKGLGLIIVDHMQLVHGFSRMSADVNRVNEMSFVSRSLKEIARELKVPVLALSQLSRAIERRNAPVPALSDLKDSGSIEQDADVVMFIHRQGMYNSQEYDDYDDLLKEAESSSDGEIAQIVVAKHRRGETRTIDVRWVGPLMRFEDFYLQPEPGTDEF